MHRRLVLGTALATSAFVGGYRGYVRRAYADCTGVGGVYTCSGPTTTTQTLNGSPLTVTTDPGFSIDTTGSGASAFTLNGTGGLTFTDNNLSTITGDAVGINATNNTSGALSITATGTVTGIGSDGIAASNSSGTYLTIEAADVNGAGDGIDARNDGSGALSIIATGTVTGTSNAGIFAYAGGTATDLTIEAADVSGGGNGVSARNLGTGALSVTTTGIVTGGTGNGIFARNYGTDMEITADAAVTGSLFGISATNDGSGALTITANGDVTAVNSIGINAQNRVTATDLTVTTGAGATVTGGTIGISATNDGSGAVTVVANGDVIGATSVGIAAQNFGVGSTDVTITTAAGATVTGDSTAIVGSNFGAGALTITANGDVVGGQGISAQNDASASDITINATNVSGNNAGIGVFHQGSGDVTINAVDVSSDVLGIFVISSGAGAVSIASTEAVTGTTYMGVYLRTYSGTDAAIHMADVSGASGISARHDGSGALSITTTGMATGTTNDGIFAYAGGATTGLTIEAVDVSGGTSGINARNYGSSALSITTTGQVTGTSEFGIDAFNSTGTGLAIDAVDVSGGTFGIRAVNYGSGALSVTTTGTVTGTSYDGILAGNAGTSTDLTIDAAEVSGGSRGIFASNAGTGALLITATGSVTGNGDSGIYAVNMGTSLTIDAVDVSGGTFGIRGLHHGSGALSITTRGEVTGNSDIGIYALNNSDDNGSTTTVTVEDGSAVSGGAAGVQLVSRTRRAASVENAGAITGPTGILSTAGATTISNTGAIDGTGGTAIDLTGAGGPSAVNQQGGTISGDILLSAGPDTVNVTGGAIEGDITGQGSADVNFDLGGGAFTFAAPFTISGIDHVAVNSGTVDLDGTLDADTLAVTGGALFVDGAASLTGGTTVEGGALSVNGSLTGDVSVLSGRLEGTGTIFGDTGNLAGGLVAPGNSIGTLTIAGDYAGDDGLLEIEAELGGDDSPSDLLVVTGDTSGSTDVRVINLGGTGAQTVEGIKVIDVGGVSTGGFTLIGDYVFEGEQAVVAGAYAYVLQQGGTSTPDDGDWYLRSSLTNPAEEPEEPGQPEEPEEPGQPEEPMQPIYAPGVPLYEAYAGLLTSFNQTGTLRQRVGNRSWTIEAQGADAVSEEMRAEQGFGTWAKIEGAHGSFKPETSTTGAVYDLSFWKLETGLDMPLYDTEAGRLVGGVAFQYGRISSDIASVFGEGSIDATGYGLLGTVTWYGSAGFYVDGQAKVTWFDSDIYSDTLGTALASGNDGRGYALSVEAGQRVPLDQRWSLTPQAQLGWSSVDFDDFTDPFGAAVSLDDGDSLVGRLGLSADYEEEWLDASGETSRAHLYGIANLYYDFLGHYDVDVSGVRVASDIQALWGGLGVGGTLSWADGKYSLFGEALARTSLEDFGDSHVLSGTVGFRVNW